MVSTCSSNSPSTNQYLDYINKQQDKANKNPLPADASATRNPAVSSAAGTAATSAGALSIIV